MAFNRELSQFAAYLDLDASGNYVGITTAISANVGIGSATPGSKLTVVGDTHISGVTTSLGGFVGDLTGDVTGDLTGNVTGNVTGDLTGDVTGNVTGNLTGNVNGYLSTSGIVTASAFHTGAEGSAIRVTSNTISGPATITLDPAGVGDNTGTVVIAGNLQIDGTTTTINSTTVTVDDKNIQIADGAINDAAADGAGFTVTSGDGNKTFQFVNANDSFQSSISLDVASGQVYKVNGTEVLSSDTLGSGVVNSSLTSVGTLGELVVSGVTTSSGGFSGNLTGNVTGNADTATAWATARDLSLTGDGTATLSSVDGTANVSGALTLATVNSNTGSFGSTTEIPVVTVNAKGLITAVSTAAVGSGLTVTGDSGSEDIDLLTESLAITGGTNLTSTAASNGVSIALDDNISLTSVVASGIVTATGGFAGDLTGDVTGDVTGNADTATALATARDLSLTGDGTATLSGFDGTANVSAALTLATVNSNTGSFGSSTAIPVVTVNAKGLVTAVSTAAVGTALTVTGDSGSEDIDLLTESLAITGGSNLTSTAASNGVSVALNDNISLTSVVTSGVTTASAFHTGAEGSAIRITSNTISGPATLTLDPAGVGDNTGTVVIAGNLQIDGTTTTVNSTTMTVDDKNIVLADGAANDAAADGGGFTVTSGEGNKTFQFEATGDNFGSSEHMNLASGKVYKINNTEVLNATTLGSGVVNSSLTSVGTLGELVVSGVTTSSGGFSGNLTGNVTGDLTGNVTGNVTGDLTGDVTGDVTGNVTGNVTGDLTGNVTGNVTGKLFGNVEASSGISTFNDIAIDGVLYDVNDAAGTAGYILKTVGTGVSWTSITDVLPQTRTTQSFTATAGQTAFSFTYNVNYLDVYLNGVKLASSEYTASNGTTVTLSEGAFAGDIVELISYNTAGTGSGTVSSMNDLSDVTLASQSAGDVVVYDGSGFVNQQNLNLSGIVTAAQVVTSGNASIGGDLTITGNLTVDGGTTVINSTTLTVDDLNIVVASGAANAAAADGAGLTVDGANATLTYVATGDKWSFNKDVHAPNFNSTSDRNLKDNIRVVEGASELVSKLEGVHFTWKSNGQETIGVIAQQIEEHLPQLVQTGEEHKSVNYNGLIGVLIEAVKEQGKQIEALKAQIANM